MLGLGLRLAEKGLVPESIVRFGIRRLLEGRLREIERSAESDEAFAGRVTGGPIAVATDDANEQHYELPPAFFEAVLGRHLKYSGCDWSEATDLDTAEADALDLVCRRAGLEDGQSVLDLGCGWGSLSLWIAERYPSCEVTAISNSAPQRAFVDERAAQRGLTKLTCRTADINDFTADRSYDRILSIEMFEHVRNHAALFRRLADWLAPEGRVFVHVFCHRRYPYLFEPEGESDWMARHFFTGGMMPSAHYFESVSGPLSLERRWRVGGRHYERTALAWLKRLDENRELVLESFRDTYGEASGVWFHRWRLFFLACAGLFGFRGGSEWFVSHTLWSHAHSSPGGRRSTNEPTGES